MGLGFANLRNVPPRISFLSEVLLVLSFDFISKISKPVDISVSKERTTSGESVVLQDYRSLGRYDTFAAV